MEEILQDQLEQDRLKARQRRASERDALARRLRDDDEDDLAEILERCGEPFHLTCTCCGAARVVESRCRKRWCPVCSRAISAKRVAKYVGAVDSMQWPLFLTLTVPNLPVLRLADIKAMRAGFRRMRQRVWWERAVKGGVASVEVTNTGKGWHPHIHAIIDTKWLSVKTPPYKPFETRKQKAAKNEQAAKEVAAAWAAAMRMPKAGIKIKRAYTERSGPEIPYGSQSIAVEVLKYAVKSSDLIECKEPIGDLIRLMGAARLVSSWGSCYGKKLEDDDEKPYSGAACACGATGAWMPDEIVDRIAGRPRRYV